MKGPFTTGVYGMVSATDALVLSHLPAVDVSAGPLLGFFPLRRAERDVGGPDSGSDGPGTCTYSAPPAPPVTLIKMEACHSHAT